MGVRALQAEIDEATWSSVYKTVSRPFDKPETGKFAVKIINHYGDEELETIMTMFKYFRDLGKFAAYIHRTLCGEYLPPAEIRPIISAEGAEIVHTRAKGLASF